MIPPRFQLYSVLLFGDFKIQFEYAGAEPRQYDINLQLLTQVLIFKHESHMCNMARGPIVSPGGTMLMLIVLCC